ncbi:tumor necrosis factor ligand superfamily member 11-like, partial [Clarias magur]
MDMEHGSSRFQPPTQSAHRPLIFGTLAVMGLLQVASSVTILLHLTGYLREVDLSSAQPIEEVHSEPIIADAYRDIKRRDRKKIKDTPVAHLSVKTPMDFAS